MYSIIIKYNDKHVQKYLDNANKNININSKSFMARLGDLAYARALIFAPFKTGALRKSIIIKKIINDANQKSIIITTKQDPDTRRRKSFEHTSYVTFVNYLHNGKKSYLESINWHGKIPDFLTNDYVHKDIEDEFKVGIIKIIKQSVR